MSHRQDIGHYIGVLSVSRQLRGSSYDANQFMKDEAEAVDELRHQTRRTRLAVSVRQRARGNGRPRTSRQASTRPAPALDVTRKQFWAIWETIKRTSFLNSGAGDTILKHKANRSSRHGRRCGQRGGCHRCCCWKGIRHDRSSSVKRAEARCPTWCRETIQRQQKARNSLPLGGHQLLRFFWVSSDEGVGLTFVERAKRIAEDHVDRGQRVSGRSRFSSSPVDPQLTRAQQYLWWIIVNTPMHVSAPTFTVTHNVM